MIGVLLELRLLSQIIFYNLNCLYLYIVYESQLLSVVDYL